MEPDIDPDEFALRFGDQIQGKTVVLYCSVGVRSSRLAQAIGDRALAGGARGVYNLRGGIFAWHNYGQKLAVAGRKSDVVHPYSRAWSRYLDFPNYTSYGKDRSWWLETLGVR